MKQYEVPLSLWLETDHPITWGTADVVEVQGGTAYVYDAKFGRLPITRESVELQMKCYAAAAMQHYGCPHAEVWIGCPRTKTEFHGVYSDPLAIAKEIDSIIGYADHNPTDYRPSATACRYCKAQMICPAFRKEVIEELPMIRDRLSVLEPERFPALLEMLPILEKFAKDARERARELLRWNFRLLDSVTGIEYVLRERNIRRITDIRAARKAASCLEDDEVLDCCEMMVGRLEDKYATKSVQMGETRTKVEALKALAQKLREERAIEINTIKQLVRRENE